MREREPEIESAIVARVQRLAESEGERDSAYLAGLRGAVAASVRYAFDSIERGAEWTAPIPDAATEQARRAARYGVRLATILRRYAAGSKALEEFIVVEAGETPISLLSQILSEQGRHIDRFMKSVSAEYADELEHFTHSAEERRINGIVRLLKHHQGAPPRDLDYDFDCWHVGVIVVGENPERSARGMVRQRRYRALHVARDQDTAWVWLAGADRSAFANLEGFLLEHTPAEASVAVAEPREGLSGWRLTHYEAQMALLVMLYRPQKVTRCRDVMLLAAVLQEHCFAASLVETYLAPLDGRGDSGSTLRQTLRAYFDADQNAASTAAALGVARHTVERRLRAVEDRLSQTINACGPQLQVALSVEELVRPSRR